MEEIQDLSKRTDFNNCKSVPKSFIGFKSPVSFYRSIEEGSITLEDQKSTKQILKHMTNHEKKLSNCLMIILELYLKLNTEQNMDKVSKYQLLNKYSKDYQ